MYIPQGTKVHAATSQVHLYTYEISVQVLLEDLRRALQVLEDVHSYVYTEECLSQIEDVSSLMVMRQSLYLSIEGSSLVCVINEHASELLQLSRIS